MKAVETNLYYAKATFPVGNPWKSPWATKDEAEFAARHFCSDWAESGLKAKATVFYRDGSAVSHWPKEKGSV